MDEAEYTNLLEQAYNELPEVLYKAQRFEVPQVKGKLIKSRTVISNFRDIAKHLSREEDHLSKFMLKEVGVRGEVDGRGDLVLHSRFQPAALNKAVSKYFETFVKCSHCNSPDTYFNEPGSIQCKACGHREKVVRL